MAGPLAAVGAIVRAGTGAVGAAAAASAGFADLLKSALTGPQQDSAEAARESSNVGEPAAEGMHASQSARLTELRRRTDELTEQIRQRLHGLLAEHGIDAAGGFHLRLDPFGQVQVTGKHPQKRDIERLFDRHPELTELFHALAEHARRLRSAELGDGENSLGAFDLFIDAHQAVPSFDAR